MDVPSLTLEDTPISLVPWAFQRKPQLQIAVKFLTHMWHFDPDACVMFWLMSTWHDAMTEKERSLQCKISTDTVYNMLKTQRAFVVDHTKRCRLFSEWVSPLTLLETSLWVNIYEWTQVAQAPAVRWSSYEIRVMAKLWEFVWENLWLLLGIQKYSWKEPILVS